MRAHKGLAASWEGSRVRFSAGAGTYLGPGHSQHVSARGNGPGTDVASPRACRHCLGKARPEPAEWLGLSWRESAAASMSPEHPGRDLCARGPGGISRLLEPGSVLQLSPAGSGRRSLPLSLKDRILKLQNAPWALSLDRHCPQAEVRLVLASVRAGGDAQGAR